MLHKIKELAFSQLYYLVERARLRALNTEGADPLELP